MRSFVLLATLAFAAAAHAQFRLPNFDVNRLVDTVKNVGKAVRDIDEPEEIGIGRDVASRLLGAAPLVADPALQRYVNRVGRWLAAQTERPDLPWQFGVLDSPNVNAFAVPGGTIFITRGLLEKMRSEAELAGVLGHEVVHVLRKHHLKAIQKGAQSALAGDAMSAALRDRAGPARDKLIAFGTEMYSRGLDKSDELEADRLGVVIAARGGYDAYGLPTVLQTLQAMSAQDTALALMFKTHPAPGERLDSLGETMQPFLDAHSGQAQLAERFVRQLKK
ncbi:MAG: peptidase Ste24p [Burkholderiales bacterium]|jgi:predicted Zn-dependent protease|nr:peptidase Ste24p [Burkholderiales bacterium]